MDRMMDSLPDPQRHAEFYADVTLKRGLAWLVDMVLIGLLTALVVLMTAFVGLFFLPFLFLVIGFAYRYVALARWSATPGMALLAIRFRNAQGRDLTGLEAFLLVLIYTVSIGMVAPQVVSVVLMLTSARGQGLGDHLLGVVAINRAADA